MRQGRKVVAEIWDQIERDDPGMDSQMIAYTAILQVLEEVLDRLAQLESLLGS